MQLQDRSWGSSGNLTAVAFACQLSKGHSSAGRNRIVMISCISRGSDIEYPQGMICYERNKRRSRNFII